MKRMFRFVAGVLIFALLAGCSGSGSAKKGAGTPAGGGEAKVEEIRLGALFPLTGSVAALGTDAFNGAEVARQIINDQGGINGKKIVFVKGDATDANAAQSEAERLISQEKVQIILGTYSSGFSVPASAVAERHGVVYWETSAIADNYATRNFKYAFRTVPQGSQWGEAAIKFIGDVMPAALNKDLKQIKVAHRAVNNDYGVSIKEKVGELQKQLGFQLTANELYDPTASDYSPLIAKYKAAAPDVIMTSDYTNDAILWYKQSLQLGFKTTVPIVGSGGEGHPDFYKAFGADAEGIFSLDPPNYVNTDNLTPENKKIYEEFHKRFKAIAGHDVSTAAGMAFSGAMVLFQYVLPKTAGVTDPNKVREVAMALDLPMNTMYNGWGVKFAANGQNERGIIGMNQWQNGKLQLVWPKNLAIAQIKK